MPLFVFLETMFSVMDQPYPMKDSSLVFCAEYERVMPGWILPLALGSGNGYVYPKSPVNSLTWVSPDGISFFAAGDE